ncbi:unnamed protein product [Cylicostephanus goldi]|uniref:Uncharacterized protein n=1 Tax=Cylicostephanus goldi TaxID=71465 RepID=A0A3P7QVQ5_CYLGO|nr:unnamed protein product [Cylicostephanus goldi]
MLLLSFFVLVVETSSQIINKLPGQELRAQPYVGRVSGGWPNGGQQGAGNIGGGQQGGTAYPIFLILFP